jgi:hypothetical protein
MAEHLKPQDLLVALKLAAHPSAAWTYPGLASELHLSASETHAAIRRLRACRLYSVTGERISRRHLLEFLSHGLWYTFPAEEGALTRGIPTAWSAAPLAGKVVVDAEGGVVWPSPKGAVRGHAIPPLYRSAPAAAAEDPALYELLALTDAVRAGRPRERHLAREELARRLS